MKTAKPLAVIGMLLIATNSAYGQSAGQIKQTAITGAQVSGGVARIATEVCQIDQNLIDAYKERARNAYAADQNFEGNWIIGWNNQQHVVDDILKLQANSHDEYAARRSETCARIRNEMKL